MQTENPAQREKRDHVAPVARKGPFRCDIRFRCRARRCWSTEACPGTTGIGTFADCMAPCEKTRHNRENPNRRVDSTQSPRRGARRWYRAPEWPRWASSRRGRDGDSRTRHLGRRSWVPWTRAGSGPFTSGGVHSRAPASVGNKCKKRGRRARQRGARAVDRRASASARLPQTVARSPRAAFDYALRRITKPAGKQPRLRFAAAVAPPCVNWKDWGRGAGDGGEARGSARAVAPRLDP
ncbi:hypothetical protein M885DRAFT_4060 [Pelagophyceae sp. CCMP2097]|nr:hypothetical protein M885DRAFT_4060 [Pelagophyceae sp. CCMP2097]